jgi:branched-chain amino acid transport system ATP-binding protein
MTVLKLENVSTFYGAIQALNEVSVEVNQGEIVTLIGANGAGKTTLLMSVCGNPRARSGRITFLDEDITQESTHVIMQRGIAISPEGRRVFPDLTVAENLNMGAFFLNRAQTEEGMEHVFDLFPRLRERIAQKAATLSGGEQQMLSICRALMSGPDLLIVDEPTEGLAPLIVQQVGDLLQSIAHRGVAVLLVEQKLTIAMRIAHRVYVMGHGRVMFEGTPEALRNAPDIRKSWLEV